MYDEDIILIYISTLEAIVPLNALSLL